MSQREEYGGRLDEAYWEVNAAASRLISYGCGVSAKYLSDRRSRMQFNRELAYYARRVMDDVYKRRISPEHLSGFWPRRKVFIRKRRGYLPSWAAWLAVPRNWLLA
jgi:hypothetical protein